MPPGSANVTEDVIPIDDDVAKIDADAEFDARSGRYVGIAFGHLALDVNRAAHCVDDAGELDQQPVTSSFDDTAAMFDDPGIDQFAPDRFQRRKRAFFVGAHQPGISDDISSQDRSQPPLDPLFAQSPLPAHASLGSRR